MGLLARKGAAHTTQLQGQCQRVLQYQTPVTCLPSEWLGHLSHMPGAVILDFNVIDCQQQKYCDILDMFVGAVKSSHDTVGLCMLPASPVYQQQVQLTLMLACRDAQLDSRLLTVHLLMPRKGKDTTSSNTPQVAYLVLVGKAFPQEMAMDSHPTMHTRVGKTKSFQSLVVGPVNPIMTDAEQKSIPKKRNNAALWSHVWPIDVWTGILTELDILPLQSGNVIVELEASPNLALHLLPRLLELDWAEGLSSMWLGCHGRHCPAKKHAMISQLEKCAAEQSGKSSGASKRQLTSQKSETDDTLGSLPGNIYIFQYFIYIIDIFDIIGRIGTFGIHHPKTWVTNMGHKSHLYGKCGSWPLK